MKYKKGYCMAVVDISDFRNFIWLKEAAMQCEEFILGIPNAQVMEDIYPEQVYDVEIVRDYWLNIKWISDVVILDMSNLDYQKAYEELCFDVCFYGSWYGTRFNEDTKFMKSHGVAFLSLLPKRLEKDEKLSAVELPLAYYAISKKIILFGTGAYFKRYMEYYGDKYPPAYAIDSAEEKWGTRKNGLVVKKTTELLNENPANVFIVICSKKFTDMAEQLQGIGSYDFGLLLHRNEVAILENYKYCQAIEEDIKETLKKIQEINYDMLEEFDRVCRLHEVQYFLNYGSLLGAIRHKGFIPWDNDIDTAMTRENYEKLSQYKDEFNDRYYWLPIDRLGNKKYYDCVPRLGYKAAYIRLDEETCQFYENQNNRIHLDMLFIDKTYDNFRGKWQRFELAVLYGLMNAYRHKSFFFDYNKKMRFANTILMVVGRCIPLPWLKKRVDKVARRFDKDVNAPYFFVSNDALDKLSLLFPKRIFDHSIDMKFGKIDAQVACGYDEMCRMIFGDYMVLPPKKIRVPHLGRYLITSDLYVFEEPDED